MTDLPYMTFLVAPRRRSAICDIAALWWSRTWSFAARPCFFSDSQCQTARRSCGSPEITPSVLQTGCQTLSRWCWTDFTPGEAGHTVRCAIPIVSTMAIAQMEKIDLSALTFPR